MLNFPPPPPPPSGGNQLLNQLADYYRQLVDYHQRAAELAAQQLAHIEALLNPNLLPDFSGIRAKFDLEEDERDYLEDITPLLELPSSDNLESQEEENTLGQEGATITDDLLYLFENNRGKVLHIDYIVRKIYGIVPPEDFLEVTQATKKLLEEGAKQKKWYAMPDSPECWTIELKEFPDLHIPSTIPSHGRKSGHPSESSRLPYSKKLAQYDTTTAAIIVCLQENYPHSVTTTQVLNWLYPEGIAEEFQKKAAEAINNILSKGVNSKGWRRIAMGQYVWTG